MRGGTVAVLGAVSLLAACADSGRTARSAPVAVVASTSTVPAPTTTATLAPPATTATVAPAATSGEWVLLAVGDVLMDDTEPAGVNPLAGVVPALSTADLAVVNAEMVVATGGVAAEKSFVFRAPPSAAATLAAAGVDVANLANNHSLDFGPDAMLETVAHLRDAGVVTVGAGADGAAAYAPAMFSVAGTRVAVLGATRVVPRRDWAAGEGPGVASAYDRRRLVAAVRAARAAAEVVVVAVHWGQEGAACPEPAQEELADALLDAGAAVVLGSHPHVLQPVRRDPRGVVAYSLGNFVFHRRQGIYGETGVLEVRFAGARVVGQRLYPHVLFDGPPHPAGPVSAARIAAAAGAPCLPPAPPPPAPQP
ncbi:MAG: CapA family protein [Acidimicrobiales bacterium]